MVLDDVGTSTPQKSTDQQERRSGDKTDELLRRRQLVDAAVGLFVKQGFHETTTPDIAHAAGWSVGELYEFVKSKGDILYHVCEVIHEETEALLEAAPSAHCPAEVALRGAMETYFRACDTRQDVILLIYQESNCLAPDLRTLVMQSEERITSSFLELVMRGINDGTFAPKSEEDARLTAHNIVVLGQMWAFRRWYFRKHYTLDAYITAQTDNIMGNLTSR